MSDRELDAAVATEVMGWRLLAGDTWVDDKNNIAHPNFRPSTSIAAAWQVVEKMHEDGFYFDFHSIVRSEGPRECRARFSRGMVQGLWRKASTAPLAICRAALKSIAGGNSE